MTEPSKSFVTWLDRLERMSAMGSADADAREPVREMMREDAIAVLEIRSLMHARDELQARVTELQARGTELVLENRELKRKARLGAAWKRLAKKKRRKP